MTAPLMTPAEAVHQLNALLDDVVSGIRPPLLFGDTWPHSTEQDDDDSTEAGVWPRLHCASPGVREVLIS